MMYKVKAKFIERVRVVISINGKLRHLSAILSNSSESETESGYILEILDRKNEMIRPPVANIDMLS